MNKKIIMFLIVLMFITPASAWYNASWLYKVDNSIPDGARPYQISLNISNLTGTNNDTTIFCNGHCNLNFTDVRFTLNDAITIPYWIEDNSSTAKVWVNVTDNGTINMYYGNPIAATTSSGNNTFRFFSDCTNLSDFTATGSAITENGRCKITGTSSWNTNGLYSNKNLTKPLVIEYDYNLTSSAGGIVQSLGGWTVWTNPYSTGLNIFTDSSNSKFGTYTEGAANYSLIPYTTNVVYKIKILVKPVSGFSVQINDTIIFNNNTWVNSIGTPEKVVFQQYYSTTSYIDNIRVRNFATIEPSLLTWGSESFFLFSICNNAVSSSTTTNSVLITCALNIPSGSGSAWVQYGGYPNKYKFRTDYQTVTGNFSKTIKGLPLQAGGTYFYKVMVTFNGTTSSSSEGSFTLPLVNQITDYQFDTHTEELANNGLNITESATTIPKTYTDILGSIFWGIVFGFIFTMMWLRQEDITIPSIVGLLIGASLWFLMPPDWVSFVYSLTIVSFAGLVYSLLKTKS